MLTLEEQERRAYINGDTQTVELLARVTDELDEEIGNLNDEIYELKALLKGK